MKLRVTWQDGSGGVILERDLEGDASLQITDYFSEIEQVLGHEIDQDGGYVPTSCGDIFIEIAEEPGDDTAACWDCMAVYLKDGTE